MRLLIALILFWFETTHGQSSEVNETRKNELKKQLYDLRKRDMLIYPGTKWCGRGTEAVAYNELGKHRNTDMCCRTHDQCNSTIKAWKTKYHYFNWRPYTVSACSCDNELKRCLKDLGTSAAREVHYLYFELLGIPCFVTVEKTKRICQKRTWYLKCTEHTTVKRKEAKLIDP